MWTELAGQVLIALITAAVTVRLSLRNFYTEKWWERQAEAYSEILESLSHMKRHTDAFIRREEMGESVTPDQQKIMVDRWRESKDRIDQVVSIGAFIISNEADQCLSTLQRELSAADGGDGDWLGIACKESDALEKGIKGIRQCAKRELRRDPWWKRLSSN